MLCPRLLFGHPITVTMPMVAVLGIEPLKVVTVFEQAMGADTNVHIEAPTLRRSLQPLPNTTLADF